MEEAADEVLIGGCGSRDSWHQRGSDGRDFWHREEAADAGRERRGVTDGADRQERRGGSERPRFLAPERRVGAGDGRVWGLAEPCAIVLWTPTLSS
jgi:hypothetical protein